MPHFIVEYSPNIESYIDVGELCNLIRETAIGIDAFPMPGVRVRATKVDHYSIADGNSKHGFVDVSVRLRAGRDLDVKKPSIDQHSLALSFEMRDIDPDLSPKCGSIRDHL